MEAFPPLYKPAWHVFPSLQVFFFQAILVTEVTPFLCTPPEQPAIQVQINQQLILQVNMYKKLSTLKHSKVHHCQTATRSIRTMCAIHCIHPSFLLQFNSLSCVNCIKGSDRNLTCLLGKEYGKIITCIYSFYKNY